MKKYILLVTSFIFMIGVYSQERIITVGGDTIYAKIMEVNENTITYKRYAYQEGATFILNVDKISHIIWENGDIDTYVYGWEDEEETFANNDMTVATPFPAIVERNMSGFMFDNGIVMDEEALESFMIENHLGYYWKTYTDGSRMLKAGKGLLIGGGAAMLGAMAITSMYYYVAGETVSFGNYAKRPFARFGIAVSCAGALILMAGIPLTIVGSLKRSAFVTSYNEHCAGKYPSEVSENVLSWRLSPSVNGFSFTLNF
ncbi:MAG: hypothetical protein LBL13_02750 [Bacteroidales bacterium]|jgi:hypothetical protein|nr:hypothetical protein [Bacteroidales bacterium]